MRGFVYLVLVAVMLTGVDIFGKISVGAIGPYLLTFLRASVTCLLIAAFLAGRRGLRVLRPQKRDLTLFLLGGFFGVTLGIGFYFASLRELPLNTAIFLDGAYPLWVAALSVLFLKERLGVRGWLATGFTLAGILTIAGFSVTVSGVGSALALLASLGYAVLIIMMRYIEQNRGYRFWDAVFWPFLFGALFLVPFVIGEGSALPTSGLAWLAVAGVVGCGFLAYLFWALGLRTVRAHNAPLIVVMVNPVLTVLFAWLLLGEPLPAQVFLGGSLIVLANIVVEAHVRSKRLGRLRELLERFEGRFSRHYHATP